MIPISDLLERTRQIQDNALDKFREYELTSEDVEGLLSILIEGAEKTGATLRDSFSAVLQHPDIITSLQELLQKIMGNYREFYHVQQFGLLKEIAKISKEDYLKYAMEFDRIAIEAGIKANIIVESKMVKAFEDNREAVESMIDSFHKKQFKKTLTEIVDTVVSSPTKETP